MLGIGCSHLAMLLLIKLHGPYRWAHAAAFQIVLGLATLAALGIVFEIENLSYFRLLGVLGIATAAITLITPVFSYLSRSLEQHDEDNTDPILRIDSQIARCKKELMDLQAMRERLLDRDESVSTS